MSGPASTPSSVPANGSVTLDNLGTEDRTFPPSAEFVASANFQAEVYERAAADPEAFWAEQANRLSWATPFSTVLDWTDAPHAKWFGDGELNVAYNCVDRHVEDGYGDTVAIHWEGEPGDSRAITYADLQREVSKTANALISLGLKAGDRVAIYLPMIPEAVFSMLACARLGLAHSVVFAGFSAEALRSRIADAQARLVITADGQYRRGSAVSLKTAVDEAVSADDSPVEHVLVVRRTGIDIAWNDAKDLWWHDLVDDQSGPAHPGGVPRRAATVHPVHLGHHREAQGHPAHLRRLPHPGRVHPPRGVRPQTRLRRLLVHRRHRLGDRTLLHRLRAAGEPGDRSDLRGHPERPARGPALGDRRQVRRDDLLHRADVDPHLHEVGRRHPRQVQPRFAAGTGQRRRTDQPRGLDVVPGNHRAQQLPDRGHLVADRDRRHDDLPAARRDRHQARDRR